MIRKKNERVITNACYTPFILKPKVNRRSWAKKPFPGHTTTRLHRNTNLDANSIESVCSKSSCWNISTNKDLFEKKISNKPSEISPRALQILMIRELTMILQIIALIISLKPSKFVISSSMKIVMIERTYIRIFFYFK